MFCFNFFCDKLIKLKAIGRLVTFCLSLFLQFFNTIFFEKNCYHTIIFEKFVITLICDFEVYNLLIALDLKAITYVIHPV